MSIALDDLRLTWMRSCGVDHACLPDGNGWWMTACGTWTPGGLPSPERRRVCRRCRERLRVATEILRADK